MFRLRFIQACCVFVGTALCGASAIGQEAVDVELVLAVDVSRSMDQGELELQRQGYVQALMHQEVINAIKSGFHGRIALSYVEWAGSSTQVVLVPWTVIADEASAGAVAARLKAAPMQRPLYTSISGALTFSVALFDLSPFRGERQVIDISGDGPNNMGEAVVPARNAALARDLVINGLPIMVRDPPDPWSIPNLDQYYTECVVGGPGSFVLPVHDPGHLAEAIRRKLVLEIAGHGLGIVPAAFSIDQDAIDCLIGEKLRRMWSDP